MQIVKQRRWMRWGIEILVLILIIMGVRAWQQRSLIEGEAPVFQEVGLAGEEITLAEYRGKPLLLHFWASWCPMCEIEQSAIQKVNEAGWPIVTIAYSSGEADEVRRYMERKQISNWLTIVDNDGELARQYGVIGVPTTYVIDPDGLIRFREVGLNSSWGLRLRLWLADHLG